MVELVMVVVGGGGDTHHREATRAVASIALLHTGHNHRLYLDHTVEL